MCVCVRVFNGVCLCVEMEVESKREGGSVNKLKINLSKL